MTRCAIKGYAHTDNLSKFKTQFHRGPPHLTYPADKRSPLPFENWTHINIPLFHCDQNSSHIPLLRGPLHREHLFTECLDLLQARLKNLISSHLSLSFHSDHFSVSNLLSFLNSSKLISSYFYEMYVYINL